MRMSNSRSLHAIEDPTEDATPIAPLVLNTEAYTDRFVGEVEVGHITNLSRSTRWRLQQKGQFPRTIQLSPGRKGWLLSEVTEWVKARAAEAAQ
jgi:prophage regulatory protein